MSKALFLQENLRPGEVYVGLILGQDGQPDYHLVLLPGELDSTNWADANTWAAGLGGQLPDRQEARILWANCPKEFKREWYWLATPYAGYPDYAWLQDFSDGYQYCNLKSDTYRARAVRRLFIIE